MVASAGGLDALTRVLAPLPPGIPAALLIFQHTRPEHDSYLAEILNKRTELPVAEAQDGQDIVSGTVMVAPAGYHLLVTAARRVALIECGQFPPDRPSGDLLLTTMATALGTRAVAVVLSGAGHDGAT